MSLTESVLTDVSSAAPPGSVVMIYGSYAHGLARPGSDFDLVIAGASFTASERDELISVVRSIHRATGAALDEEVPYLTKLCATWDDLAEAATGGHFMQPSGRYEVEKVVKSPAFLGSRHMALRLWQNVLTGKILSWPEAEPHVVVLQQHARRAFVNLYVDVTGRSTFQVSHVVTWLVGTSPLLGEDWLGFKPSPPIVDFLMEAFEDIMVDQANAGLFKRSGAEWLRRDTEKPGRH